MLALGRRSVSEKTWRHMEVPGFKWDKSDWMLTTKDPDLSPTAFLVEQHPETTLVAHFHKQNQFQVFVHGSGRIGGHEITGLTVHYAGAFTGYGPIVAGAEGLKYMTMRAVYEQGAVLLSDAKGKMPKGPKRGAEVGPIPIPLAVDLTRLKEIKVDDALAAAEDGLAIRVTELPPGTPMPKIAFGAAQGAFIFITAGSLDHAGEMLTPWESIYITADEPGPLMMSGPDGAQVLSMFLPHKHERYASLNTDDLIAVKVEKADA